MPGEVIGGGDDEKTAQAQGGELHGLKTKSSLGRGHRRIRGNSRGASSNSWGGRKRADHREKRREVGGQKLALKL